MKGKVAIEEHFAIDETLSHSEGYLPDEVWSELSGNLMDFENQRLAYMDEHGIEMMVLSLNAPAVQAFPDPKRALAIAQKANDVLAEQISRRPNRFSGFAALPMQDVDLAIRELERCMVELRLVGVLANGFTDTSDPTLPLYYDLPQYKPFWKAVDSFDVPFYLHPRNPLPAWAQVYRGHEWLLGPTWGFAAETAVHALRLMGSGLFDEFPRLQIILGHMGEGLPFNMWRIDNRNSWSKSPHHCKARKKMADYFRSNFNVTTSGNFRTPAMIDAISEIGADRVLYAQDYPMEAVADAAQWFDPSSISEPDRLKIGRTNAIRLLKLPLKPDTQPAA